ncbi:glutathione transferase GstA [Pseudomonas aeruginosa]|nr:glutathione transferase GstA [Pseudomonas aeruginosa]
MKLFFTPGTCSLVAHILLHETAQPFTQERVELASHRTAQNEDYYELNPKGYVPLLQLDDGQLLSEGPVIAQYLCERAGRTDLLPAVGTLERYRVLEWQAYISSELHKSFSPLFNPSLDAAAKAVFADVLLKKFSWVSAQLAERRYLCNERFTLADAYLFTVASWSQLVGLDLSALVPLQRYLAGIAELPAVRAARISEATQD